MDIKICDFFMVQLRLLQNQSEIDMPLANNRVKLQNVLCPLVIMWIKLSIVIS